MNLKPHLANELIGQMLNGEKAELILTSLTLPPSGREVNFVSILDA
jgi:hypothetical protein